MCCLVAHATALPYSSIVPWSLHKDMHSHHGRVDGRGWVKAPCSCPWLQCSKAGNIPRKTFLGWVLSGRNTLLSCRPSVHCPVERTKLESQL